MNQRSNDAPSIAHKNYWIWPLLLGAFLALFVMYWDGLKIMVDWWQREEYSHGYMIPLVSLFILWQRLDQALKKPIQGSWIGLLFLVSGIVFFIIGKLSLLQIFSQYGFLLSLIGLGFSFFGKYFMRTTWAAFTYLVFMIPLPSIIYGNLSAQLQLISSLIGVVVIRLFGISVFLEGNVIDLGPLQLQVAEACSGLRYLFPLMSFGFLIGYLYRGPKWQRIFLFLSAIPITVFMNSLRIGIIGVTVDYWGIEMAEGFLHDFEGWVVFMGCVGVLFLEIVVFQLFSREKQSALDLINLNTPPLSQHVFKLAPTFKAQKAFIVGAAIIALTTSWHLITPEHTEQQLDRKTFISFPNELNGWKGERSSLERHILDQLKLSDYIQADYLNETTTIPVNLYVAWYNTQRSTAAIHSPLACIPGAGWVFDSFSEITIPDLQHVSGNPLRVNRAIIRKGDVSQLVYFWYDGRNRNQTYEYLTKWFVFWDLLIHSRSDGALVRVVTYLPPGSDIEKSDQLLQQFLKDFYPLIPAYVP